MGRFVTEEDVRRNGRQVEDNENMNPNSGASVRPLQRPTLFLVRRVDQSSRGILPLDAARCQSHEGREPSVVAFRERARFEGCREIVSTTLEAARDQGGTNRIID